VPSSCTKTCVRLSLAHRRAGGGKEDRGAAVSFGVVAGPNALVKS
jgi:hypothetical protein